jgi:hypothetical protein
MQQALALFPRTQARSSNPYRKSTRLQRRTKSVRAHVRGFTLRRVSARCSILVTGCQTAVWDQPGGEPVTSYIPAVAQRVLTLLPTAGLSKCRRHPNHSLPPSAVVNVGAAMLTIAALLSSLRHLPGPINASVQRSVLLIRYTFAAQLASHVWPLLQI